MAGPFPPLSSQRRAAVSQQSGVADLLAAAQRSPGSTIYRIGRGHQGVSDHLKIAGKPPFTLEPTIVPVIDANLFVRPDPARAGWAPSPFVEEGYVASISQVAHTADTVYTFVCPQSESWLVDHVHASFWRTAGAAGGQLFIERLMRVNGTARGFIAASLGENQASGQVSMRNLWVQPGGAFQLELNYNGNAVDQVIVSAGVVLYAFPIDGFQLR